MWKWVALIFAGILAGILFTIGAKTVEHYWRDQTPGERDKAGAGKPRTQKGLTSDSAHLRNARVF